MSKDSDLMWQILFDLLSHLWCYTSDLTKKLSFMSSFLTALFSYIIIKAEELLFCFLFCLNYFLFYAIKTAHINPSIIKTIITDKKNLTPEVSPFNASMMASNIRNKIENISLILCLLFIFFILYTLI